MIEEGCEMLRLAVVLLAVSIPGWPQQAGAGRLCPEVITTLYMDWLSGIPLETQARIELRNCRRGQVDSLQVAAWTAKSKEPALVVDTGRDTISRLLLDGNVFLLIMDGASDKLVQVVVYDRGSFQLALQETTQGKVRVQTSADKLTLRIVEAEGLERVMEFPTQGSLLHEPGRPPADSPEAAESALRSGQSPEQAPKG
jgi:hypothetical protein